MSKRFILIAASLATAAAAGTVLAAQTPRIANARLTTQAAGTPFAESFRTLVGAQSDIAWIGYMVPVVDSDRRMCCADSSGTFVSGNIVMGDGAHCCAACRLEPSSSRTVSAASSPQTGPIQLEGSRHMAVLFRIVERQVDRVRVFSADCELDAGGTPVTWLEGVQPAESIALLESMMPGNPGRRDRITNDAIAAIALHRETAADAALDRLIAADKPESIRKQVTFWLGNARGARGLTVLSRILENDPSTSVQKGAVFGVSQSDAPGASDALLSAARNNANATVRGEAIFWLGQKAGAKAAATIKDTIDKDPETEVKKRAVFALSQLPKDEGVPLLINVARTNKNPEVRKQAMFWLAQSKDPRAIDFFAEILK